MNEVLALAMKDLRLLLRDKGGFIFAFIFPAVYAVFFGMIFSGVGQETSTKMQVAVVDLDETPESEAFIEAISGVEQVEVAAVDREEAIESVRRGRRMAYVEIPDGFGANRDGMFWGDPPDVKVGIDPSRQAEGGMLQGILIKCSFDRMQEMFNEPDVMTERIDKWLKQIRDSNEIAPSKKLALELFLPALKSFMGSASESESATQPEAKEPKKQGLFDSGLQPVIIRTEPVARKTGPKISSYAWSFPQGIIWGVMGCSAAFGISLVIERTSGTLVRLRMSPIHRWQILAGKAFACFVTTLGMIVALLLLAAFAFNVRPHSVALLGFAVVSVAFAFVGIMMLLSVLGKTEQSAGGIGWAVLLVMAMIGGGMVPRIFMPSWLQTVSHVSPVKWGIQAMEGALWRGFSTGEMVLPCGILLGIGVISFAIGVRAFRWTE